MPPPATTPPASGAADLGKCPSVLDASAAIALMDNSAELYREIALAYLQEVAGLGPRIAALLRQANPAEAARTLHANKGLSLTVGANLLSDVCRQCEQQLKTLSVDSQAPAEATFVRMQTLLDDAVVQTQAALNAVLARMNDPAPGEHSLQPTPLDRQTLVAELLALRGLLEKSDLQALDRYAALQARFPSMHDDLQSLGSAIKIFDFSQAVVQCEKLIRHCSDPI